MPPARSFKRDRSAVKAIRIHGPALTTPAQRSSSAPDRSVRRAHHRKRAAQRPTEICVESWPLGLLHFEDPNDTALGHVVADTNIGLCQLVLDTLSVDFLTRLDGDVLAAVDLIGDRCAGDAGVGLLLPQHVSSLGVEGTEHAVVGAADKDEVATGDQHGGHQLPPEIMLPRLFTGGRVLGLKLAIVIRARTRGSRMSSSFVPSHSLPGSSGSLTPRKPPQKLFCAG